MLLFIYKVLPIINRYLSKKREKERIKEIKLFIKNKKSITINLEAILVDGFHHDEMVAVDIYDNHLNSRDMDIYYSRNYFDFKNKHHKDKRVTVFSSKFKIPFKYNGKTYEFKITLPIDEISVRMKMSQKKTTEIYIKKGIDSKEEKQTLKKELIDSEKLKKDVKFMLYDNYLNKEQFYLDLRFLEIKNIDFVCL